MRQRYVVCLLLFLLAIAAVFLRFPKEDKGRPRVETNPQPAIKLPVGMAKFPVTEVRVAEDFYQGRILRGFYDKRPHWRWTAPRFAVSVDVPEFDVPVFLELDFAVPTEIKGRFDDVTLTGRVNGVEVGHKTYTKTGRFGFAAPVPREALRKQSPAVVEFESNRGYKDEATGQERGVIVISVALNELEQTVEYRKQKAEKSREAFRQLVEVRRKTIPRQKYLEMLKLFHKLPVWDNREFGGVKLIKNPLDLWIVQQIIHEQRPDFIVETGTLEGGSALFYAYTLNAIGLTGSRVITVDIGSDAAKSFSNPLWKRYVDFYHGSSTDPKIVAQIAERVKGKRVMIALDSDHRMFHVLRELKMYSPMLHTGEYIIVEDTHLDGVPTHPELGLGPYSAVQRFLTEGGDKDFEVDESREALVMTFNPGGWLRRK